MAKKSKLKIPKEVAGIKIPKDLRKSGNALIEKAASPQGREMIAAGLTMAVAAASAAAARRTAPPVPPSAPPTPASAQPGPGTPPPPPPPSSSAPGQAIPDPQMLADTLGTAAEAILGKLFARRT